MDSNEAAQEELERKRKELERLLAIEEAERSSGALDETRFEGDAEELRHQRMIAQEILENQRLKLEKLLTQEQNSAPADREHLTRERQKAMKALEESRDELERLLRAADQEAAKHHVEPVLEREVERRPDSKGCLGAVLGLLLLLVLLLN